MSAAPNDTVADKPKIAKKGSKKQKQKKNKNDKKEEVKKDKEPENPNLKTPDPDEEPIEVDPAFVNPNAVVLVERPDVECPSIQSFDLQQLGIDFTMAFFGKRREVSGRST
jgi:hypothetical protein